ncbi:unnamed protein product [Gulo gulo]|uniref:Uncharacterized protein n=1 Tax=Gulo gulo TaxID=48420 RepID=A0A9X9MBL6_GULGU|nr:unnamed protein product [Gulo gulo]
MWTTVAMVVTRLPGHQPTAEVPLWCPARQGVPMALCPRP